MARATAPDVVVLGGANSDYMVRGPILPKPGETVPGDVFDAAPGGKGANQALAAARLGARVAFVGRVGADERGRAIVDTLSAAGVDVSHVVRDPGAPTGVALVQVDEAGEKQMLTLRGANWRVTSADVRAAAPMIRAPRSFWRSSKCRSKRSLRHSSWRATPASEPSSIRPRRSACPTRSCGTWT